MNQSNHQWDLGRFLQTLTYFEAVPVFSWVQKMFGAAPSPPPQPQSGVLFDFQFSTSALEETWGALDDVVMGGVSASSIRKGPEGAEFFGNVSTSNSGGFASVRTRNFNPPLNLSQSLGLEIDLQGDGNRYKFLLRDGESWDSIAYAYSFDTIAGEWQRVRIPFAELVPVFRAKTVGNASGLDAGSIRSLQVMLSKFEYDGQLNPHFQPGSFSLTLRSIQAF
jgi:Complex I intermediate-associated protein 30 (CIA30)